MTPKVSYIEVLHPGIACSIQDAGRVGYLSEGIPMSGFMDFEMAGLANLLLGNNENTSVIEWKLIPPKLKFSAPCQIVITGIDVDIYLNSELKEAFKVITIKENDSLSIRLNKVKGYGYIAIKGGIRTEKILGSRSFYPNITKHSFFKKRMKLPFVPFIENTITKQFSKINYYKKPSGITFVDVFKGPEFELMPISLQSDLCRKLFSINNQSNRMGFLLNEFIEAHKNSIISSPVLPGTVQWTPSGKLIVLMRDAQTVGGYPRILQLTESSISQLAKVPTNGFIQFVLVTNAV